MIPNMQIYGFVKLVKNTFEILVLSLGAVKVETIRMDFGSFLIAEMHRCY